MVFVAKMKVISQSNGSKHKHKTKWSDHAINFSSVCDKLGAFAHGDCNIITTTEWAHEA